MLKIDEIVLGGTYTYPQRSQIQGTDRQSQLRDWEEIGSEIGEIVSPLFDTQRLFVTGHKTSHHEHTKS